MQAISFPKTTELQVLLNNLLSQSPIEGLVESDDAQFSYRIDGNSTLDIKTVKITLRSEAFGTSFIAYFDEGVIEYACLDSVAIRVIPTEIKLALLWARLSQSLHSINAHFSFDLQVEDICILQKDETEKERIDWVFLEIKAHIKAIDSGPFLCHGKVYLPNNLAMKLVRQLNDKVQKLTLLNKSYIQNVRILGSLKLAHTELATTELSRVELNDIVLFDDVQFKPDSQSQFNQQLKLNIGIQLQVDVEGKQATILNIENINMSNTEINQSLESKTDKELSNDHDQEREGSENNKLLSSSSIAQLPVNIEFVMDKIEVPLSDVASLSPGYTFALKVDARCPVTAVINGKPIAKCELVDIEGRLGARILEKLDHNSKINLVSDPEASSIITPTQQETEEN